jgi:hypothetical protein
VGISAGWLASIKLALAFTLSFPVFLTEDLLEAEEGLEDLPLAGGCFFFFNFVEEREPFFGGFAIEG